MAKYKHRISVRVELDFDLKTEDGANTSQLDEVVKQHLVDRMDDRDGFDVPGLCAGRIQITHADPCVDEIWVVHTENVPENE